MNLKESLKNDLTEDELKIAPRSYEAIGDIAILEIPEELVHKEKLIAKTLLETKKNVRLVVKKGSEREGEFRLKNYEILAGEGSLETGHKENYCRFFLDISKVYFSGRESTERERMAQEAKDGERILVMGAGIGPFPIVIAKSKNVDIVGVDANPDAVEYFEKNIERNKLKGNIEAVLADVREFGAHHLREFDRVIVTMPQQSIPILNTAAGCVKDGGTLHLYVTEREEMIESGTEMIDKSIQRKHMIKSVRKVLPYSPGVFKYCIEILFIQ